MDALPTLVAPADAESAGGYLLRLLTANGSNVKEVLAFSRGQRRKHLRFEDVWAFAGISGVSVDWFSHRIPKEVSNDRWLEIELFDTHWRSDWLLRGTRQQVCPVCLYQDGIARLEWDLLPYVACHLHHIVLQDVCRSCGRAIAPDRPSLDVCGCGSYLALRADETEPCSSWASAWCAWLARQIAPGPKRCTDQQALLESRLSGASPDGAYRLLQAYAGGPRAFHGALLNAPTPWLSTSLAHQLISVGCEVLCAPDPRQSGASQLRGIADGLAEQSVRGINAWDRALAQRYLGRLRQRPRWRNVRPGFQRQLDLFDDVHELAAMRPGESAN